MRYWEMTSAVFKSIAIHMICYLAELCTWPWSLYVRTKQIPCIIKLSHIRQLQMCCTYTPNITSISSSIVKHLQYKLTWFRGEHKNKWSINIMLVDTAWIEPSQLIWSFIMHIRWHVKSGIRFCGLGNAPNTHYHFCMPSVMIHKGTVGGS
jgi:hypothetical protein